MLLKLSPAVFSTEPLVHLVPHVAMFGCPRDDKGGREKNAVLSASSASSASSAAWNDLAFTVRLNDRTAGWEQP